MFKGIARHIATAEQTPATENLNTAVEVPAVEENVAVEAVAEIDLTEVNADAAALESAVETFDKELATQTAFFGSVEKFGADAGLVEFALRVGTFNSTALETGSVESMNSEDSSVALEAIVAAAQESLKDRIGSLASRAGEFISKAAAKARELVSSISAKVKSAGGKIKETAKAHPYATAAGVAATVAVAATVIAAVTGKLNPAAIKSAGNPLKWKASIGDAFNAFKNSYGTKQEGEFFNHAKMAYDTKSFRIQVVGDSVPAKAGEWTAEKVDALAAAIAKNYGKVEPVLKSFGTKIQGLINSVKDSTVGIAVTSPVQTGKDIAAQTAKNGVLKELPTKIGLVSVIVAVYGAVAAIISGIVIKGIQFVKSQIDAVSGGGESAEPAAAE